MCTIGHLRKQRKRTHETINYQAESQGGMRLPNEGAELNTGAEDPMEKRAERVGVKWQLRSHRRQRSVPEVLGRDARLWLGSTSEKRCNGWRGVGEKTPELIANG